VSGPLFACMSESGRFMDTIRYTNRLRYEKGGLMGPISSANRVKIGEICC